MSRSWPARLPAVLAVLAALVVLAGCADEDSAGPSPVDPEPAPPTTAATSTTTSPPSPDPATTRVPPGYFDLASIWTPTPPDQPVDPRTVRSRYAEVVDALVAASGEPGSFGPATLSTADFYGQCVVALERVGDDLGSDPDDLRATLAPAASGVGFPDLDFANDPGGALTYVAHDEPGALLEVRSKVDSTVTVRVATTADQCPES